MVPAEIRRFREAVQKISESIWYQGWCHKYFMELGIGKKELDFVEGRMTLPSLDP